MLSEDLMQRYTFICHKGQFVQVILVYPWKSRHQDGLDDQQTQGKR